MRLSHIDFGNFNFCCAERMLEVYAVVLPWSFPATFMTFNLLSHYNENHLTGCNWILIGARESAIQNKSNQFEEQSFP